jgi:hypothetical protein
MKSQFLKTTVTVLLVLGVLAGTSWAKKTNKANELRKTEFKHYQGTVEVTRDKTGAVETVKLKVGKLFGSTYYVSLDEKGKDLAERMVGKQVKLTATMVNKAGTKWLGVKEYKEVVHKPAKKSTKR